MAKEKFIKVEDLKAELEKMKRGTIGLEEKTHKFYVFGIDATIKAVEHFVEEKALVWNFDEEDAKEVKAPEKPKLSKEEIIKLLDDLLEEL